MSYNRFFVNGYLGCVEMNFNNNTYAWHFKSSQKTNAESLIQIIKKEKFLTPSLITNAIVKIGIDKQNLYNIDFIISCFHHLLCKHIVVDFDGYATIKDLRMLFKTINKYNIHETLLILNYSELFHSDEFAEVVLSSNRLKAIIIFSCPFNKNLENYVHYYKQTRKRQNYNKSKFEFIPNNQLFLESLNHHSYFNRKLYLNEHGVIKNASECKDIFGLIHEYKSFNKIEEIIKSQSFQKYWNIKKDDCTICKDCEYRYMCIDNRLPFQAYDNNWYHKIECNYNPYIAKWKGDEGYITVEEWQKANAI